MTENNSQRQTLRQVESAIIEFFRAEGGEILNDGGETYLVINDEEEISLSDLARELMDPGGPLAGMLDQPSDDTESSHV
jgi:hypothetical protein